MGTMIQFNHVNKQFTRADRQQLTVLKDVDLVIEAGSIFGIIGYSGAGKSTLIRLINGIETPTDGEVLVKGVAVDSLDHQQLRDLRRKIGMIFQQFNLMPSRTVFENVALPIRFSGLDQAAIRTKVTHLLELVGLPDKADVYPATLSGGQKQRVAIARALVSDPEVLLCDEATSALDPQTTADILQLIRKLNAELGITVVVVTHEMQVIEDLCVGVAVLDQGQIVESGNVYNLFSDPKQPLTKKFIATTSKLDLPQEVVDSDLLTLSGHQQLIKITYVNSTAIEPLISYISREFQVNANIIVGDIKILQQKPLGGLVIILDGSEQAIDQSLAYLKAQQIRLEVLKHA